MRIIYFKITKFFLIPKKFMLKYKSKIFSNLTLFFFKILILPVSPIILTYNSTGRGNPPDPFCKILWNATLKFTSYECKLLRVFFKNFIGIVSPIPNLYSIYFFKIYISMEVNYMYTKKKEFKIDEELEKMRTD